MIAQSATTLIGVGLYTPQEAALYAGVATQKIIRWVHGTRRGSSVVRPSLPDDEFRTVTFLDFIQALAIRTIRNQFPRVSLQKLRAAAERAEQHYNIEYPFARQHTTYVVDETDVVIGVPGESDADEDYFALTGKHRDQAIMKTVYAPYMKQVKFEGEYAVRYTPLRSADHERSVFMDPRQQFGQPMLECGFTAETLMDAYLSEGSVEAAADAYEVAVDDVQLAVQYYDTLPGAGSRAA